MHGVISKSLCAFSLFALSACANQPLLFTSANSLGVSVSVSGASTNPIDVSLGYKDVDATLVPVASFDKGGTPYAIRGCYGFGSDNQPAPQCANNDFKPTPNLKSTSALSTSADAIGSAMLTPVSSQAIVGGLGVTQLQKQQETMSDALSVFSSFDTKTNAESKIGAEIGLGKVFATGIAAQQLTEGQNIYIQNKGAALSGPVAECLRNLTTALGPGKATESDVQMCAPQTSAPSANH